MPKIELKQAEKSDHQLIVNLMQFYNYDFSEWVPLSFAEDGFFAIRPKLEYLASPTTIPLLILVDAQIAGFVIGQFRPLHRSADVDGLLRSFAEPIAV